MAKPKIRLDSPGIGEMLKSAPVRAAVRAEAEEIAARVRADPNVVRHKMTDDVVVDDYTTDRAAVSVSLAHPGGLGMEAKHGVVSKAVGA